MFNARLTVIVCAFVAMATIAGSVRAQDWPQWRGPNRDGKVTGFVAPQKWPSALAQRWSVPVGTGDATPALVGDKLYVFARQGDDEVVLCLNAADGKDVWKHAYAAEPVKGPAGQHAGPRSSPAVAEGKVAVLGVGGILTCLDAASGAKLWQKDEFPKLVPQFATSTSPIIAGGMCIVHLGGKDNGAIIAFDAASGVPKWKWAGEGPTYDSPVVATIEGVTQLVTFTEKSLVGIALADGKLLWQVPTQLEQRMYNCATPIVSGATVIYTGQGQGTRALKVEKQGDAFTTKELWHNPELGTAFNSPVLKGDLVFGINERGLFYCLNAKTGKTAWADTTRRDRFGSVLDAGTVMLALCANSELVAFAPSGAAYEELARIKVASTPTYAHPVVAGDRVFIKDDEKLTLSTLD